MFTWNLNHFHHKHTKLNKMAMNNWSTDERWRWGQKAWGTAVHFLNFIGMFCFSRLAPALNFTYNYSFCYMTIIYWPFIILHVYSSSNDTPRCHSPLPQPSSQDSQYYEKFITRLDHWHANEYIHTSYIQTFNNIVAFTRRLNKGLK